MRAKGKKAISLFSLRKNGGRVFFCEYAQKKVIISVKIFFKRVWTNVDTCGKIG